MKIYSYETLDSTNEFMKNNVSKYYNWNYHVKAKNQSNRINWYKSKWTTH